MALANHAEQAMQLVDGNNPRCRVVNRWRQRAQGYVYYDPEHEGGILFKRSLRAEGDRRSQAAFGYTFRVTKYSKKRFVGSYEVTNLGYHLDRAVALLCKRDKSLLIDRQNNLRR